MHRLHTHEAIRAAGRAMDRSIRSNTIDSIPCAPARPNPIEHASVVAITISSIFTSCTAPAWILCVSPASVDRLDRPKCKSPASDVQWHRACSIEEQHRSRPVLGSDIAPSPRREAQVASRHVSLTTQRGMRDSSAGAAMVVPIGLLLTGLEGARNQHSLQLWRPAA